MSKKNLLRRQRMRLSGYDYSNPGRYFITIECNNMECRFGTVRKGKMIMSDFGKIARDEWLNQPGRYNNVVLDVFQFMPNHMHAIIELIKPGDKKNTLLESRTQAGASPASTIPVLNSPKNQKIEVELKPISDVDHKKGESGLHNTLSEIIGAYKSIAANSCLKQHKQKYANQKNVPLLGKIWKRSFHDHIIRDEASYKAIKRYIRNNVNKWNQQ